MPGSAATRTLQSHRYGDFAENGDDDSDEDEDNGRPFAMVRLLWVSQSACIFLVLRRPDYHFKGLALLRMLHILHDADLVQALCGRKAALMTRDCKGHL